MAEDFLVKIRGEYNQFTKAEKKVADYILASPKEVLFKSITELAEICGVGDTSVFRFCKTMNCKGYQEFKMMLSLSMHEGKQGFGQMEGNIGLEDDFGLVAQKVLNSNINALKETHSLLKEENFSRVIECFYRAKRICFYGVGTSMSTAMKAADKFLKIEPKVYCVSDSHMQAMMASTMTKGEAAVIFSYSGATKDTIHVAQLAKAAGADIICVTRFVKSPLTAYADLVLLCGANESPLQAGSSSAEISQLFLIDLLYTEYYRRYFETCCVNNERTSASVMEKLC
ncbi:MurR/RpiR family transcriptional regulator [Lacrimispora sp. 210928-DFI.3.58]|mgnify:FL=1|uniref:MurR/RpiR family transcriptional regulator n=1 Tax=Lacrimispora sp. 210928-DFI.3.58 TaxID=2883214 RepID=UPI0015B724A8|nr:MurR/RpiR family transcriptional regulator [Lacrimispora sp. 210928-DFI.3.58]MCB7317487.1 MurR/RpiR family transcriptional regulator [Lacrimispora sp. 210928-DFI.3.58]